MERNSRRILFNFKEYLDRYIRFLIFSIFISSPSFAQLNGSVSIANDYVYRGTSFSQSTPVAQLHLGIDDPSGIFVGGFALKTLSHSSGNIDPHRIIYTGIARRISSELAWEIGIKHLNYANIPTWNYEEIFAGLSSERINFNVHYSPKYLGQKHESIYAEFNSDVALNDVWSVTLHNGVFYQRNKLANIDSRLGISGNFSPWIIQLAMSKVLHRSPQRSGSNRDRSRLITTLSYTF